MRSKFVICPFYLNAICSKKTCVMNGGILKSCYGFFLLCGMWGIKVENVLSLLFFFKCIKLLFSTLTIYCFVCYAMLCKRWVIFLFVLLCVLHSSFIVLLWWFCVFQWWPPTSYDNKMCLLILVGFFIAFFQCTRQAIAHIIIGNTNIWRQV